MFGITFAIVYFYNHGVVGKVKFDKKNDENDVRLSLHNFANSTGESFLQI